MKRNRSRLDQGLNKHMVLSIVLAYLMVLYLDYFTQKGNYAIKGLFFCDDTAKITLVEMGWPGHIHDNRVWSNSNVYLSKEKYFSNKEYLLGDSAFLASM